MKWVKMMRAVNPFPMTNLLFLILFPWGKASCHFEPHYWPTSKGSSWVGIDRKVRPNKIAFRIRKGLFLRRGAITRNIFD